MLYSIKSNKTKYKKSSNGFKYSSKEYSNPFFDSKKKKPNRTASLFYISKKIKISLYAFFVFLICAAAFLLYSPYFIINEIEITGEGGNIDQNIIRSVVEKNLAEKFYTIFKQGNIFLFNKKRLEESLRNKYVFRELEVWEKLPNKLIISYIEEKYAIIYEEAERYYYADEAGNIIKEADVLEINQKEYPILKNRSLLKAGNNRITLDPKIIGYAISAFSDFQQKKTEDLDYEYFELKGPGDFSLKIKNGPLVYINLENDFISQFDRLLVVKDQKLKDNFFTKEYIDLRFGESIYFR